MQAIDGIHSIATLLDEHRESMSTSELDDFFRNKWKAPRDFYHLTPKKQEEVMHNLKSQFVSAHKIILIQDGQEPSITSISMKKVTPHHIRVVGCSFCGRNPETHNCSKLFPCPRKCGAADYCSKLCEKSHRMQGHRPFCGSKPVQDSNKHAVSEESEESEDEFDDWLVKPKNLNKSNDTSYEIPEYPFPVEDDSHNVSDFSRSGLLEPVTPKNGPNSPWLRKSADDVSNRNSDSSHVSSERTLYRTQSQQIPSVTERAAYSHEKQTMALPSNNPRRVTRAMSFSEGRLPANAFLIPAEPIEPTVEMSEPTNSRKLA